MAALRRKTSLLFVLLGALILILWQRRGEGEKTLTSVPSAVPLLVSSILSDYNSCLLSQFSSYSTHKLWSSLSVSIEKCLSSSALKNISINEYHNGEEKKWHVPVSSGQVAVVSIGIGGDILAEQALINDSAIPPVFFGADPIYEGNDELYSSIGYFFPFAIGGAIGFYDANVLFDGNYWLRSVVQLDLPTFLRGFVPRSTIDALWMDAEGGEFAMMDMLHEDGELDKQRLTLCQIHMEAHQPNSEREKMLKDFLYRIAKEEKYVLLRATGSIDLRIFLLNVSNGNCLRRFVLRFFMNI